MRRFTRLTNALIKKVDNHIHALALYFTFCKFVRIHRTIKVTPVMAAGITGTLWSMKDVMALIDVQAEPTKKRRPYKPRLKAV